MIEWVPFFMFRLEVRRKKKEKEERGKEVGLEFSPNAIIHIKLYGVWVFQLRYLSNHALKMNLKAHALDSTQFKFQPLIVNFPIKS